MARTRSRSRALALYRPAPKPIVIRTTKMVKAKHHRKHHRSSGFTEKHRMGAIVGGAVMGLLDKSGIDLPTLPFLGKAGTVGVAAWAVGKYMRSPWAEDLATGMLSIAAYELAKEGSISGVDGYVAGGL